MKRTAQFNEEDSPRVLICAADVGCGHGRAATAILLAMRRRRPRMRILTLDALTTTPTWFNQLYRDSYLVGARHLPRLNGWLYDRTDTAGVPTERGLSHAIEEFALQTFLDSDAVKQAELIVCTHFLCARVLSRVRGRGELKARLAVVVTDQHPHAVWRVPHADLFMVASESAADVMMRNGTDPSRIVVTGIPIDARFDRPIQQPVARIWHGIPENAKVILLTGGGLGLGGVDRALEGILSVGGNTYTIVVCGHNDALRDQLTLRTHGLHDRCRIIGVTSKMHELMAASDLLVGKPGGLTTSEAAAVGLPMVLLRPIPGQEERNAKVLVDSGAAILCPDPHEAGRAAAQLVMQREKLTKMQQNAQCFGRPCSAKSAADAALQLCRNDPITTDSEASQTLPHQHQLVRA